MRTFGILRTIAVDAWEKGRTLVCPHVSRVKRSLWCRRRALRAYKNRQSNSGVVDLRSSADLQCSTKIISRSAWNAQRAVKALQTRFHYQREQHRCRRRNRVGGKLNTCHGQKRGTRIHHSRAGCWWPSSIDFMFKQRKVQILEY